MKSLNIKNGVFTLQEKERFLLIGEFQYFRIKKKLWAEGLSKLKSIGFNGISTYVPWVWHEVEEGNFDFRGKTYPERDLIGFIEECKKKSLFLVIKPGPLIYAEYRGLGNPLWIGERYKETVMLKPNGKPHKGDFYYNYSLLHPTYLSLIKKWFSAVIDVIQPYFNDPIVMLQIDNETGLMFYNQLGELDFNSDTINHYQSFLEQKYQALSTLNQVFKKNYSSFSEILPPEKIFGRQEAMDWQIFLEVWVTEYLLKLKELIKELGVDLPLLINEPATYLSPTNPELKEPIGDIYGYNLYTKATGSLYTADFPFSNSQYPALFKAYTSKKPLFAGELGSGWFDKRAYVSNEATLQVMMGSIAHGVKGFCLFPVHDGVEITGEIYNFKSILDYQGNTTPRYDLVTKVNKFIVENEQMLISSTAIYDPIAILTYFPNFRFTPQDYLPFQIFPDPIKYMAFLGHYGIYALLLQAGFNPEILSIERVTDLKRFKVVIFPTKGFISPDLLEKLREYIKHGGNLITLPKPITEDIYGNPLQVTDIYPEIPSQEIYPDRLRLLKHLIWHFLIKYNLWTRPTLKKAHKTQMHICDTFEPLLVGQHARYKGIEIKSEVGDIRADYYLSFYEKAVTPILKYKGKPVGYISHLGLGKSIVIGTLPGGCFLTPTYYQLSKSTRTSLTTFITHLMKISGVEQKILTSLEIEVVIRNVGKGYLVFIINRLGKQEGILKFKDLNFIKATKLFSYKESSVLIKSKDEIELTIDADDVVVINLQSK
ncbi:MAG: alpha-amylase family protein [bacterium]